MGLSQVTAKKANNKLMFRLKQLLQIMFKSTFSLFLTPSSTLHCARRRVAGRPIARSEINYKYVK